MDVSPHPLPSALGGFLGLYRHTIYIFLPQHPLLGGRYYFIFALWTLTHFIPGHILFPGYLDIHSLDIWTYICCLGKFGFI